MTAEAPARSVTPADRVGRLFHPAAVTLVGASPKSHVTRVLLANFTREDRPFPGRINLVNPTRDEMLGHPVARTLADVDGDLGLVYLLVRTDACRPVLEEAAAQGLGGRMAGVVVYAAGFGEAGNAAGQRDLVAAGARLGVPMLGPQSTGLISAPAGLLGITDPVPERFVPGRVGFVAQSTGLLGGAVGWLMRRGIGVGQAVGYGNGAALSYPDLAAAMLREPDIDVVCVYVDAVTDVDGLVALGRLAAEVGKPVVLFGGARAEAAQRAARSHTGVLATGERIVRGVAEQYGVLLVDDFEALLWAAELFVRAPVRALRTGRVGVFTASGGGGIIAAESIERAGLTLAEPTAATLAALGVPAGGTGNPYDIGAISLDTPEDYRTLVGVYAADPTYDVIVRPASLGAPSEALPDHTRSLRAFIDGVHEAGKLPLVTFPYPEDPAGLHPLVRAEDVLVAGGAAELAGILRLVRQWATRADPPPAPPVQPAPDGAASAIAGDAATRELLAPAGLDWPAGVEVDGPERLDAALAELRELAGPGWSGRVVAKTASLLPHRAKAGGVLVGLHGPAELAAAVGYLAARFGAPVRLDEQVEFRAGYFAGLQRLPTGQCVLAFGAGTATDESDVALRLCPLRPADAEGLLDAVLPAGAQRPAALAALLVRLSELGPAHPELDVLDLNPLVATADGRLVALDAKAYLRDVPTGTERTWT
jgi:acyl-CoA synthetase (NDP forming)